MIVDRRVDQIAACDTRIERATTFQEVLAASQQKHLLVQDLQRTESDLRRFGAPPELLS